MGAAAGERGDPPRGVTMRVLVTGAGGQVGTDVRRSCDRAGDEVVALGHHDLDVTDRDAVLAVATSVRPDVVIHSAAWTAVDACEADAERAYAHNALAVRWVAEGCRRVGSHLVHLSTDYVFSGDKAEPYVEWDPTGPLSVYGASKLAGEREATEAGIGATIVRTSWVVGEHGHEHGQDHRAPAVRAAGPDVRGRPARPADVHLGPGRSRPPAGQASDARASTTSRTRGR